MRPRCWSQTATGGPWRRRARAARRPRGGPAAAAAGTGAGSPLQLGERRPADLGGLPAGAGVGPSPGKNPRPMATTSPARLRVLSGMQPTGTRRTHLGNYLGALRNWVSLQDEYEMIFFVADYHSLTTVTEPSSIRPAVTEMVLDWLAAGIDPERSTVFLQSWPARGHRAPPAALHDHPAGLAGAVPRTRRRCSSSPTTRTTGCWRPGAPGRRHPAAPRRSGARGRGPERSTPHRTDP